MTLNVKSAESLDSVIIGVRGQRSRLAINSVLRRNRKFLFYPECFERSFLSTGPRVLRETCPLCVASKLDYAVMRCRRLTWER